jgi:hypothetical protein
MRRAGWAVRRPSWVGGRPSRARRRLNRAENDAGWVMNPALSQGRPDGRVGGRSLEPGKRAAVARIVALSEVISPFPADAFDRSPGHGAGTTCGDALSTGNVSFLPGGARLPATGARFRVISSAPTSRTVRFATRIVRFATFLSSPPAIPARFTTLTAALRGRTAAPTPLRCRRPGGERVYPRGKRVFPASGRTPLRCRAPAPSNRTITQLRRAQAPRDRSRRGGALAQSPPP